MIERLKKRIAQSEVEGGFTLIELLVVIIIIGILLAIAVPSYLGFRDRANNNAAQANVRAIVPAIEAYYSDNGAYTSMTLPILKASYDQSIITTNYNMTSQGASTYCIAAQSNGTWYKKVGPAGTIVAGNCP